MDTIKYANKYGTLELLPLEYRHVSTVHHATTSDELKFDLETAEKIALITDNHRIQLVPNWPKKLHEFLIVHHSAPDTCALCCIVALDFVSPVNPREEIQRCARRGPYILVSHGATNERMPCNLPG